MFSVQPSEVAGVRPPWRWTTAWPASAAAFGSAVPPLRPGTHCTGIPSAPEPRGARVTTTGNGRPSSSRHSTVTGWPRSASIVGPGKLPSYAQTLDSGRSRWNRCAPARSATVSLPWCADAFSRRGRGRASTNGSSGAFGGRGIDQNSNLGASMLMPELRVDPVSPAVDVGHPVPRSATVPICDLRKQDDATGSSHRRASVQHSHETQNRRTRLAPAVKRTAASMRSA